MAKKLHQSIVELNVDNVNGQVVIVPMDRDKMSMPIAMAIEACRAFNEQIRFADQFELLLEKLAGWILPREATILQAWVTTRDAGLLFLVVLMEKRRNKDIEAALIELDLDVANDKDFSLINLSVHAIPCCSQDTMDSFISDKLGLRYVLNVKRDSSYPVCQQNAEDNQTSPA